MTVALSLTDWVGHVQSTTRTRPLQIANFATEPHVRTLQYMTLIDNKTGEKHSVHMRVQHLVDIIAPDADDRFATHAAPSHSDPGFQQLIRFPVSVDGLVIEGEGTRGKQTIVTAQTTTLTHADIPTTKTATVGVDTTTQSKDTTFGVDTTTMQTVRLIAKRGMAAYSSAA